jgi:hypothetical protein
MAAGFGNEGRYAAGPLRMQIDTILGLLGLAFTTGLVVLSFASENDWVRPYFWGTALFFFIASLWPLVNRILKALSSSKRHTLGYLHYEDSELGPAIVDMAYRSAWAKWYAAQYLVRNNHQPVDELTTLNAASELVTQALMDGRLEARGRPAGAADYEPITSETWRLAGLQPVRHPASLWTFNVIPRSGIEPQRMQRLLDYDSLIVNCRRFENLWPATDKKMDYKRKRPLKQAKRAGAAPIEIAKLS